ncbi:hypothetical protein UFOVP506_39 [uncultured Caudovirales phage]|uniref:Uncharacterized protein n=1 Tax=uncultured Caudovirales phage TaxID=2100421 RepID=A0A6J5MPP9_9CAUD|nr:hypothetical protein UFOVP506_39 [uncultured Caudovirales phage]
MAGIPGLRGLQDLGRLLIPDRTPLGGVVRSSGAMPSVAPVSVMPQVAPAAPELTPTAKYIQDMQALMSGGIGPLSTGQKISAVGQVLQAAGSRGATDPGAVIQNVRKQQMEKLNAQYQIAQLQQSQQQEAAQRAAIAKYKVALTPDEVSALDGLPLEKQAEKISEIAFRQDQVNRITRGDDGKTYILFASGKQKEAGFNLPKDYEKIDVGNGFKFVNKEKPSEFLTDASGKELFIPQQMNAYQRETLGIQRARLANDIRTGGSSGGGAASYQILNTADGYVGVNRKNLRDQVPLGLTAAAAADPFAKYFPQATGAPKIIRK